MKRWLSIGGVCLVLLAFILPFDARATTSLDIDAETEAFAVRVEYDLPLPGSIGTEPHVVGEIRRTFGENAKGLAGAPTDFTAVTGGAVYDPWSSANGNDGPLAPGGHNTGIKDPIDPHNNLPTAECFYPGNPATTVSWPRDLRANTKPIPPTSYANAQCGAGPATALTAWSASDDVPGSPTAALGGVLHTGALAATSVLQPEAGVVTSTARASAHEVSVLGGAVRIGDVEAEGTSKAQGPGGSDSTTGHVALANISAGGQLFSVADDEITVAGNRFAIDSSAGQAFLNNVNAALAGTGCKLSVLGPANPYPQGFLLSRKPPEIGIAKDGTFAASMHGGMLIICDVPQNLTSPTGFTPQRVQILVGFVYSMARATKGDAGFGVGDFIAGAGSITTPSRTVDVPAPSLAPVSAIGAKDDTNRVPQTQAFAPAGGRTIRYKPLARSTRIIFIAIGIVLLIAATNFASRRLRELIGS
jgi:hypothetical protein